VIERMRRLLRNQPNEVRPLSVNETVESIVRLTGSLARRNGVSVYTALNPAIPLVKGDFVQLQQVLLNLIVNAIEAVHESPTERRRVTITTSESPPGNIQVAVADGGPGISGEKLERIFEPFFTTKTEGMGLGLSISRSIVLAHRGRIWAESDTTGATFRFILPA
jgi:signal transduction histidine kinase